MRFLAQIRTIVPNWNSYKDGAKLPYEKDGMFCFCEPAALQIPAIIHQTAVNKSQT
jgi:hypothetical protein